jgi:hypothetical protein
MENVGIIDEIYGLFYGHFVYVFYGHLVFFVVIWYIIPVLVCCTK